MRNTNLMMPALILGTLAVGCTADTTDGEGPSLSAQSSLSITLRPIADAFVRSGSSAATNYGTRTAIEVDADDGGTSKHGYMRFAIGDVGTISNAKLRLYVANGSSNGADLKVTSDAAWGETAITWNNKPAVDGALLGTIGNVSAGTWVELDVTARVAANTPFSFAIVPRSTNGLDLNAREASSNKPELILTTGSTPPSSTVTPIYAATFEEGCNWAPGTGCAPFDVGNVDTCEFDQTCKDASGKVLDSLEVVSSPTRCSGRVGSKSLRVTQRPTDVQETDGSRAEVKQYHATTLEEEYWYGFSVLVPTDFQYAAGDQTVIHQWHTRGTQPGGNPMIGLRIRMPTSTTAEWSLEKEVVEGNNIDMKSEPLTKGVWTDWVMRVRWSPTTTGYVDVWKNGALWYSEKGQNMNSGVTTGGHYEKFGMYGKISSSVTQRVLYLDEIRTAKGADGYSAVAPSAACE